jgi:uncharacterized protein YndB with AHSA1/START domain
MAKQEKPEPIRQSVHVDCPLEDAFRLFTERFDDWWPGAEAGVREFEPWTDGKIIERTTSGEEREWGTVTAWEPPHRVAFTWHPNADPDRAGTVEVEFTVEADGTRVTVTHSDWQLARAAVVCFAGAAREMMVTA